MTMPTQLVRNIDHSSDHLALPPPHSFQLIDAEHVVGWVKGVKVGFRGFLDEHEAAHAAWMAYRTVARRMARKYGTRRIPIDSEPLALARRSGEDAIHAGNREIATLVRPGDHRVGADSFGFEISIPSAADEVTIRAKAFLIYRTLRKSGLRWSLWRPAAAATGGAA
jgi:hypothetical protein